MIHFSYTGQGKTLCGGAVDHKADLKNGPVCNQCIHVMWNEQYRRNTLNKLVKREKKTGVKTTPEQTTLRHYRQKEKVVQHQMKKLFLRDWRKYGVKT